MNDESPSINHMFVYGTLRRGLGRPVEQLYPGLVRYVGTGHVRGALYEIDGYPGLVPDGSSDSLIHGEIYALEDPIFVLGELDDYEECSDRFPEPREYVRSVLTVLVDRGKTQDCWVYVYNRTVDDGCALIVSGNYADFVS